MPEDLFVVLPRPPRRRGVCADSAIVERDLRVGILLEPAIKLDDVRILPSRVRAAARSADWLTFSPNLFDVPSMHMMMFLPVFDLPFLISFGSCPS